VTDKLKDFFSAQTVRGIAADLHQVHPRLDEGLFVAACIKPLARLQLTGRAWHIAEVMHEHLPRPFAAAAEPLVASLGPPLASTEKFGLAPLRYMPHVFFVQKYGLDDFETAMHAQYQITQRFSAESSIRAFLVRYPDATYARLMDWSVDSNAHVRRLVSEATRPRLPWAPRLQAFIDDPSPVLKLLERLKDDPVRYVQRSIANNLNDIAKDHAATVVETCRRWLKGAQAGRRWIVRHALRSLAKSGDRQALVTLGVGRTAQIEIKRRRVTPKTVRIGGDMRFSFMLVSTARREQELMVDYVVHFVKARGATRPKVFKLKRLHLAPSASLQLDGKVSFAHLTTRRPYPGRHRIEIVVNGCTYPFLTFDVRPST
jgi:3-methyladenine DNA glycosylase AlkC